MAAAGGPGPAASSGAPPANQRAERQPKAGAVIRQARKDVQRLERELEKLADRETELHEQMAASASDHRRLGELTDELATLGDERSRVETAWLEAAELLEG